MHHKLSAISVCSAKSLNALRQHADHELALAYPYPEKVEGITALCSRDNPRAACAVAVSDGNRHHLFVPLDAKRGVLLPLLQEGYQVVDYSPTTAVIHLGAVFRSTADALRALKRLARNPLPPAVLTGR